MPCQEVNEVFLRAQLLRVDSLGREKTANAILSVKALDNDAYCYENKKLSQLDLPLKPNQDATTFEITCVVEGTQYHDVLTIYHENQRFFLSMECGAIVKHRLLGYHLDKQEFIKDVAIVNEKVENNPDIHLKIYVQ